MRRVFKMVDFNNGEVEKAKKTITIKMELDGKEQVFEHECDGFTLFFNSGDMISEHSKCKGSLLVEVAKQIMLKHPKAMMLAMEDFAKGIVLGEKQ